MKSSRTNYCGELREKDIDKNVVLMGWCQTRRDHGGVIFVDLRDYTGLTQVVFKVEISKSSHVLADRIRMADHFNDEQVYIILNYFIYIMSERD